MVVGGELTEHCSGRIITGETGLAHTRAMMVVSLILSVCCLISAPSISTCLGVVLWNDVGGIGVC